MHTLKHPSDTTATTTTETLLGIMASPFASACASPFASA